MKLATRSPEPVHQSGLAFGRVVVVGGGCYGTWYTQQLSRAIARGALSAREIVVVDRDPACLVAQRAATGAFGGAPVRVECATWAEYLIGWLSAGQSGVDGDAMVPSPLMPQICLDWLVRRAADRWPGRPIRVAPLPAPPPTPWERASPDGRHYVSFATWTCPVNCIEPAKCPATRGVRDWSMPAALAAYVADTAPGLAGPIIFHCVHRTYGVGMIDAAALVRADDLVSRLGAAGPVSVLVGTVSHCHGALGVLELS